MKKWKLLTIALMSMALSIVTFLGASQAVFAATQGVNVDTHTQAEIISYLQQKGAKTTDPVVFEVTPSYTQPYAIGQLSIGTQYSGLAMVNQIRYIAGLPEVTLDTQYRQQMQAAALVNAANRQLDHYPDQPAGMSDEMYNLGSSGARRANLSMGRSNLNISILEGWMGDYTSSSNLATVGHRRWVLNPKMSKTCFGAASNYYSMYAFDNTGTSTATGVVWPAQQMPLEYFGTQHPWSYSLGSSVNASSVKVTLTKRGTNQSWSFSSSSANGHFAVNNDGYGQVGCIIFRPDNVTYSDGDVFDVSITGLSTPAQYSVTFFTANKSAQNTVTALTNGTARNDVLNAGGSLTYQFTAPSTGTYTFFSEGNVDTLGSLYSSSSMQGTPFASSDDDGYNHNFLMNVNLTAYQTVYLKVTGYGNAAGSVAVTASRRYSVCFNANGGSSTPGTLTKLHNGSITLPTEGSAKTCKVTYDTNGGTSVGTGKTLTATLNGWNTAANGSGTKYALGGTYTANSDCVLFAQWTNPAAGSLPTPTRSGYTFEGWYTAKDGGSLVNADSRITTDTTLYAHWKLTVKALKLDEAVSCTMTNGSSTYFSFTAPSDGIYIFSSEGSLDTYAMLYTGADFLSYYDSNDDSGSEHNFYIKSSMKTGDTVYLRTCGYEGQGNGSYTVIATKKLEITKQPVSATVTSGAAATFKITATGSSLKYQWKKSSDGGKTWVNSASTGAATNTLTMTAKDSFNGLKFKCVVTDRIGETVESNAVTLTVKVALAITTQPKNTTVEAGNTMTMSVAATGEGLTYQWQYQKSGTTTWTSSSVASAKTAKYSFTANSGHNGMKVRCIVKDKNGKSVTSSTATITVTSALAITTQPANVTAASGATATFKVAATGSGLKYQWKKSSDGGKTWVNSSSTGAATNTLSMTTKDSYNGLKFKCVVTDGSGKTVTSNAATLTVKTALAITTQPASVTAASGATATFKVAATGNNLKYQWQKSTDGGSTWVNSSSTGATTNTLTMTTKASYNGLKFRCKVSDDSTTKYTNTVTLTVK